MSAALQTMDEAAARIKALEAALRKCVQYHVEAAADCRAISAVNQDNCLGPDSLTAAIDHDIAAEDIGEIVRAALDPAPLRFAGRSKDAGIGCGKSVIEPWSAALDKDTRK
jgi:hypothetical protein